jgi:hypothetical protein
VRGDVRMARHLLARRLIMPAAVDSPQFQHSALFCFIFDFPRVAERRQRLPSPSSSSRLHSPPSYHGILSDTLPAAERSILYARHG